MKQILFNLAMLDALAFCKANNIDPSGTYMQKYARGYRYALIKQESKKIILDVVFKKMSVPEHIIYNN